MNAVLTWNANTDPDLAGYVVYHGIASLVYTPADTVTVLAPTTTYTYTGLDVGLIHYFNIKAFDTTGNLSAFGGELTKFERYPVYLQHLRVFPRRQRIWRVREQEQLDMVAGYLAQAVGLNDPPPPPPPPETFPVYEAMGGFMMV